MTQDKKLGGKFTTWTITELDGKKRVVGNLIDDLRFDDDMVITTSEIVKVDPVTKTIETENTIYRYEDNESIN
jgi:hypothetical protein